MWILHLLPTALIHAVVLGMIFTGAAAYIVSELTTLLPGINPYAVLLRVSGIVLLLAGIYCYGGYSTEVEWRARVETANEQILKLEKTSTAATAALAKVVAQKQDTIATQETDVQKRINTLAPKLDTTCKLDPSAIDVLNQAARSPLK